MMPETQTTPMPIMDRLRQETREAHDATEAIPFSAAMVGRTLPRERFVHQLRAYAIVHEALETAIAACEHPTVRAVWREDLRKLPLLQRDLAYFDGIPTAAGEIGPAEEAAEAYARQIREVAEGDPVALLGHLYVLEGSTLGATILRTHIAAAYGLENDGLAYYSPYGNAVMPHWREFKQRMNEAVVNVVEQDRIIAAASESFRRIGDILRALSNGLSAE